MSENAAGIIVASANASMDSLMQTAAANPVVNTIAEKVMVVPPTPTIPNGTEAGAQASGSKVNTAVPSENGLPTLSQTEQALPQANGTKSAEVANARIEAGPVVRTMEVEDISELIFLRKGKEAEEKFNKAFKKNMTPEERNVLLSSQEQANYSYFALYQLNSGEALTFNRGNGILLDPGENGEYVAATRGSIEIVKITGLADPEMMLCTREDGSTLQVLRDELLRAQILSQQEDYRSNAGTDTNTQEVIDGYIESIVTGKPVDVSANSIAEAGRNLGLITSESARAAIVSSTLSPEEQQDLLALTDGRNIMRAQDVGEILYRVDTMPKHLKELNINISAAQDRKKQLEASMELTKDEEARAILRHQISQEELIISQHQAELNMFKNYPSSAEAVTKLIRQAYSGEVSSENMRKIDKAVASKDMKGLMEELMPKIDDSTEEGKKLKKFAEAALKYGGIGALALVALLIMQSMGAK